MVVDNARAWRQGAGGGGQADLFRGGKGKRERPFVWRWKKTQRAMWTLFIFSGVEQKTSYVGEKALPGERTLIRGA